MYNINDKDYYNIKKNNLNYNINIIKNENVNYIKENYKTKNFSDLFNYKKPRDKYGYLSNEESQLVDFLERLMTRNKLSVSQLRQLLTNQSPTGLSLDYKTILNVKSALDYIERKQSSQYGQNTSVSSQSSSSQQPTQTPSVQLPHGSSYNANNMWSPVSSAGTVYEWNRGVIGISYDGVIEKEKLD